MNFINIANKGYKILKTVTESYKIIGTVREHVKDADKTITEFEETVTEGNMVVSNLTKKVRGYKKDNEIDPYSTIPMPNSDDKTEIYDWIYKECRNIHHKLCKNVKGLKEKHPNIYYMVEHNKDSIFFSVDHIADWERFKDSLLLESFALKPRLDKLNEYNFDEEDMKRIKESKELEKRLNEPKCDRNLAYFFNNKDDYLLAAYYYRESVSKMLFNFQRSKTIEEMTTKEIQERRKILLDQIGKSPEVRK